MINCWRNVVALVAGVLLANTALGCSCDVKQPAGFIHAGVAHLPANARGALFLPPTDGQAILARGPGVVLYGRVPSPVASSAFQIGSNADAAPLAVQLTPLDLSRDAASAPAEAAYRFVRKEDQEAFDKHPGPVDWTALLASGKLVDISDKVLAATQMLRVAPAGGFVPGYRYTIAYVGAAANWRYPAVVVHQIDASPSAGGAGSYSLALDGLPQRRLLARSTSDGSCSMNQPAIVQDFHYVVPASLQPYQQAVLMFSEMQAQSAASFSSLGYQAHACESTGFGEAALGGGHDLLDIACDVPSGKIALRGWAGMLEVEDRLHRTESVVVEVSKVRGRACNGLGMLKEAFAARDAAQIAHLACAVEREAARDTPVILDEDGEPVREPMPALAAQQFPAARDLASLVFVVDGRIQQCGRRLLARVLEHAPGQPDTLSKEFGVAFAAQLATADIDTADDAVLALESMFRSYMKEDEHDARAALMLPALPGLVDILVAGKTHRGPMLGRFIANFGRAAQPFIAALMRVADAPASNAPDAIRALEGIASDDPDFHVLLLRQAGLSAQLATREAAALAYDRIADESELEQAVALLTAAARDGSELAVDALAVHGSAARASVPVLIALMWDGKDIVLRSRAFSALLRVGDGEPEVIAAISRTLSAQPDRAIQLHLLGELHELGPKGAGLLPAINKLMRQPLEPRVRNELAVAIDSMELPVAQASEIFSRLAKPMAAPSKHSKNGMN
ncbi:MAG: hypothetical protein V4484_00385 [Pseudomonadota bacterium]